jgi:hypothetical protein
VNLEQIRAMINLVQTTKWLCLALALVFVAIAVLLLVRLNTRLPQTVAKPRRTVQRRDSGAAPGNRGVKPDQVPDETALDQTLGHIDTTTTLQRTTEMLGAVTASCPNPEPSTMMPASRGETKILAAQIKTTVLVDADKRAGDGADFTFPTASGNMTPNTPCSTTPATEVLSIEQNYQHQKKQDNPDKDWQIRVNVLLSGMDKDDVNELMASMEGYTKKEATS